METDRISKAYLNYASLSHLNITEMPELVIFSFISEANTLFLYKADKFKLKDIFLCEGR